MTAISKSYFESQKITKKKTSKMKKINELKTCFPGKDNRKPSQPLSAVKTLPKTKSLQINCASDFLIVKVSRLT